MSLTESTDTIEIKSSSIAPWTVIGMAILFGCVGFLSTLPLSPNQNIPGGIFFMLVAAAGFFVGRVWLRNLPVKMRITPEALEICETSAVFLFADIEEVDAKPLPLKGKGTYLCIRIKTELKQRYAATSTGFFQNLAKSIRGGFDFAFCDRNLSFSAYRLRKEIERRMERLIEPT